MTAENTAAIRLYHRLGFRRIKTLYKSVEQVRRERQRDEPPVDRLPLGVPASQAAAAMAAAKPGPRDQPGVIATMVSALVSGMVVAAESADVADSPVVGGSAAVPANATPLVTARDN